MVEIGNEVAAFPVHHDGPALQRRIRPENPEIGMCSSKGFRQSQGYRQQAKVFKPQRGAPTAAITGSEGGLDGNQQIALRRQQISGKSSR